MDEDKEGKGPPNKISQTEAVVIGGNLLAVHSSVVRIECVPSFRRFDIESREATLDGPQLVVTLLSFTCREGGTRAVTEEGTSPGHTRYCIGQSVRVWIIPA